MPSYPPRFPYEACPIHGTAVPCSLCAAESEAEPTPPPEGGYAIKNKPFGVGEAFLLALLCAIICFAVAAFLPVFGVAQVTRSNFFVWWTGLTVLSSAVVITAVAVWDRRHR